VVPSILKMRLLVEVLNVEAMLTEACKQAEVQLYRRRCIRSVCEQRGIVYTISAALSIV
jgi:hypothetical protein